MNLVFIRLCEKMFICTHLASDADVPAVPVDSADLQVAGIVREAAGGSDGALPKNATGRVLRRFLDHHGSGYGES